MTLLNLFVLIHVVISLVAIASGFVVIYQMLRGKELRAITLLFLTMTVLTSVTGFGIPADRLLPSHLFGVLSLIALGLAIYGRYSKRLAGRWRTIYVVSAVVSQYLNVFVLIVQSFLKIPTLHQLAPTQSEPPFAVAHGVALIVFTVIGVMAVIRFRAFNVHSSQKSI